jgi:hypothetical protein
MPTLRRFLVLVALMFWLGGFTFYAAVVVPTGTEVLRSTFKQGMITREVTRRLNVSAVCALVVLAWDALAGRDSSRVRKGVRLWLLVFLALTQALLFVLHDRLDRMLTPEAFVEEGFHAAFRPLHRLYLWTHTVQWGAGIVFILLMLRAWQDQDRIHRMPETKGS